MELRERRRGVPLHLLQVGAQPARRARDQRGPMALEIEGALGVVGVPGLADLEGAEQGGGARLPA